MSQDDLEDIEINNLLKVDVYNLSLSLYKIIMRISLAEKRLYVQEEKQLQHFHTLQQLGDTLMQQTLPPDTVEQLKDIVKIQGSTESQMKSMESALNFKFNKLKEELKEVKGESIRKSGELNKRIAELEDNIRDPNQLATLLGQQELSPSPKMSEELDGMKRLIEELRQKTEETQRELGLSSNSTQQHLQANLEQLRLEQLAETQRSSDLLKNFLHDKLKETLKVVEKDLNIVKELKADRKEQENLNMMLNSVSKQVLANEAQKELEADVSEIKAKLRELLQAKLQMDSKVEEESKVGSQRMNELNSRLQKLNAEAEHTQTQLARVELNVKHLSESKLEVSAFKQHQTELKNMQTEFKSMSNKLNSTNLDSEIKNLKKMLEQNILSSSSTTTSFEHSLKSLTSKIDSFCSLDSLNDMKEMLQTEVLHLKTTIQDSLEEKANREETSRQLEHIMKLLDRHKLNKEPDEPLFSKRPLQNVDQCASCSRELPEVKGIKADLQQWDRFPKDNFRISHYAHGFSRTLGMLKKEDDDLVLRTTGSEIFSSLSVRDKDQSVKGLILKEKDETPLPKRSETALPNIKSVKNL